jgi:hypothetical protein
MEIIDRLYAHSMDARDSTLMDDAARTIRELRQHLTNIEAAALRNNGPLARDHDKDTLRGIGLHAQFALKEAA